MGHAMDVLAESCTLPSSWAAQLTLTRTAPSTLARAGACRTARPRRTAELDRERVRLPGPRAGARRSPAGPRSSRSSGPGPPARSRGPRHGRSERDPRARRGHPRRSDGIGSSRRTRPPAGPATGAGMTIRRHAPADGSRTAPPPDEPIDPVAPIGGVAAVAEPARRANAGSRTPVPSAAHRPLWLSPPLTAAAALAAWRPAVAASPRPRDRELPRADDSEGGGARDGRPAVRRGRAAMHRWAGGERTRGRPRAPPSAAGHRGRDREPVSRGGGRTGGAGVMSAASTGRRRRRTASAASPTTGPCADERRVADERCAVATRARAGAEPRPRRSGRAQRTHDEHIGGRRGAAAAAADPRAVRAAKEAAQQRSATRAATAATRDDVEARRARLARRRSTGSTMTPATATARVERSRAAATPSR